MSATLHAPILPVLAVQGIEDSSLVCMARVFNETRTPVTQSGVTSISCKVFEMLSSTETYSDATLVIANTVFNTLQTDARWTVDDTGYNFMYTIPPAGFPDSDRTYQAEFKFTFASGAVGFALYQNRTVKVFTS